MSFAKTKDIGRTSTGPQLKHVLIFGQSLAKGDPADQIGEVGLDVTGRIDSVMQLHLGFNINLSKSRQQIVIYVPLKDILPAFSRVFQANITMFMHRGEWTADGAGIVHNGSVRVDVYGIRRSDFDISQTTFGVYKTGSAWAELGAKIGVDLTSLKIGSFLFTQTDYDSNISLPFSKVFDVKEDIQYHLDRNEDASMIAVPSSDGWRPISALSGRENIMINNPIGSNLTQPHAFISVHYVPPIVLHPSLVTAGRALDLSIVLDKDSLESQFHLYMGFIDQGEVGDPAKYWIRNTRQDRIARRLIIECTRGLATTPAPQVTNVGIKTLRSIDVFQLTLNGLNQTTALTPRGAWYAIATSTTLYDLYFKADFAGAYALVKAANAFAADITYTDAVPAPDVDKLRIRAIKWSADVPTIGDRWDWETVSDTTDPAYPADSKPMMSLIPATTAGGDTPDTAKSRPLSGGPTQRLRSSSYVTVDGVDRTMLLLADVQLAGYVVGQKCVVFDGTNVQEVTIRQIYLTEDVLPAPIPAGEVGDAIMLEEETTFPYAAGAFFTPGLFIASLAKSSDVYVSAGGAAAAQNLINVKTAVDWIPSDQFTAISLVTGESKDYVVQVVNLAGSQVQTSTALTFTLVEGDILIKRVTTNAASFFVQGAVPEGAALGDRLALVRVYEARSSLQNIL